MVVDEDLPDGRGSDLVSELRANPRTRHVRVLFCSGASHSQRQEMARLAPVIPKPFKLQEMERALAEVAAG
jgi:CheY-like chemotaxis protein